MLSLYIKALSSVKELLEKKDADALYAFFDSARTYRDSFVADANGSVARIYDFTVNIDDRAGSMASIMNILAEHGLSIKNIGITHSRERAEGAVRLEFYDKTSLAKAREVLCEKGYTIV